MKTVTLALATVLIPVLAAAAVIHVDAGGGGDYLTVQRGVVAAAPGDTILVAPGTYSGFDPGADYYPYWGRIYIDKTLTLASTAGPAETIILGHVESLNTILVTETPSPKRVIVEGFTIRSSPGVSIMIWDGTTGSAIVDCVLEDNSYGMRAGPGIYTYYTVQGCTITGTGDFGIEAGRGWQVISNVLSSNNGGIYSIGAEVSGNTVSNCSIGIACGVGCNVHDNLILSCSKGLNVGVEQGSVHHNTVVRCTYGATTHDQASLCGFGGNILSLNTYGIHRARFDAGYSCNNVWGNDTDYYVVIPSGDDNFADSDPMFCAPGSHDYSLDEASPCYEHEVCGTIGALGAECGGSATETTSWGAVKALYR